MKESEGEFEAYKETFDYNINNFKKKGKTNYYFITKAGNKFQDIRTCTKNEERDERLSELKELLLARKYPEQIVDRAIHRAKKIPRNVALFNIRRKTTEKLPVFALKYDPRLPAVQQIVGKHWRSMTGQVRHLKECIPLPPLTAYRRQTNLRDLLVKAKIPPPMRPYPHRKKQGMSNCGKSCTAYIEKGKEVKINQN